MLRDNLPISGVVPFRTGFIQERDDSCNVVISQNIAVQRTSKVADKEVRRNLRNRRRIYPVHVCLEDGKGIGG